MIYANSSAETVSRRVEKTLRYIESPNGRAAWDANVKRGMPYQLNAFAAIQSATGLRTYERLSEIYAALGQAMNARDSRRSA